MGQDYESVLAEIEALKARNRRVEADKAWELSGLRRAAVALVTYLTCALILWVIRAPHFLLGALVPAAGYLLSTITLPVLKGWWLDRWRGEL